MASGVAVAANPSAARSTAGGTWSRHEGGIKPGTLVSVWATHRTLKPRAGPLGEDLPKS